MEPIKKFVAGLYAICVCSPNSFNSKYEKVEKFSECGRAQRSFQIMEKSPTRVFSLLKAPTSAFTFKTLLRHYANPYDFCIGNPISCLLTMGSTPI